MARERNPDLILLDVLMPGMDGLEVMRELKSADSTRQIPVIIVSALDSVADEERGLQLGCGRLHHQTVSPADCQGPGAQPPAIGASAPPAGTTGDD
jgi:CheY-like chemotaxis protein